MYPTTDGRSIAPGELRLSRVVHSKALPLREVVGIISKTVASNATQSISPACYECAARQVKWQRAMDSAQLATARFAGAFEGSERVQTCDE